MKFREPTNEQRPQEDLLFSKEWQIIPNTIFLPTGDSSLLQKKLEEYKKRINSPESSSLLAADARFKVAILEPLITMGVVYPRQIARELDISDPKSEAGQLLLNACEVVQNHIENKEEDNFEGTGLPEKTEQTSSLTEKNIKIKEAWDRILKFAGESLPDDKFDEFMIEVSQKVAQIRGKHVNANDHRLVHVISGSTVNRANVIEEDFEGEDSIENFIQYLTQKYQG